MKYPFKATGIKAVYFDMGGVLIDISADFNRFNALSFHPNLKFEECLFVGDTYHVDILGAHRMGMHPVWVNHHYNSNPLRVPEILHIRELPGMLK